MTQIFKTEEGEQAVKCRYRDILENWLQPHEQRYLDTRHGRTFVIASGDVNAPALLLFHGSGSNSVSWLGDIPIWAQHFRVYAVDMIGEPGLSEANRLPWDDPGYIEWLDDIYRELNISQAGMVGMSLGGWLALTYGCARPDRVTGMGLIAPGGLSPARKSFMFKALFYLMMGSWGQRKLGELVGYRREEDGSDSDNSTIYMGEEMTAFVSLINKEFNFHRGDLPEPSAELLGNLTMPIKLFFGDQDALLNAPASCERLAACAPQADIQLLPGVGHVILDKGLELLDFFQCASQAAKDSVSSAM